MVFIDRWASHRYNPQAEIWNKMSLPVFELPHETDFFEPSRRRLLEHYDLITGVENKTCPKIVYIDRQRSKRRFTSATHTKLLNTLHKLEEAGLGVFHHVLLEDLSVIEQIQVVSDADVSSVSSVTPGSLTG